MLPKDPGIHGLASSRTWHIVSPRPFLFSLAFCGNGLKTKLFPVLLAFLLLLSGEKNARTERTNLDTVLPGCVFNWIANGRFELGDTLWLSVPDSRNPHALIAPFDQAYDGQYTAILGRDEHTVDSIRQQVTIPPAGLLTYWWRMKTYETKIFDDFLGVNLLNDQGEETQFLAWHKISEVQNTWFQDTVDFSAYSGTRVWLNFYIYNDGWYSSTFYIDSVCLVGDTTQSFLPAIAK